MWWADGTAGTFLAALQSDGVASAWQTFTEPLLPRNAIPP